MAKKPANPKTVEPLTHEDAWTTLNSDTSRPFSKPLSGRIAVKVINHPATRS